MSDKPAVREVQFHTLGFVVKASVEGKKEPQPISARLHSRKAAEDYAVLARQQGFTDASVTEETGMEASEKVQAPRKKRGVLVPPVRK